jgi:Macrocin-O-methyltransferase (TylF)
VHHPTERSWEYENGYYLTSGIERLGKSLAQYELYKRIVGLPGDVLEFGVYKGTSLARLLTFRELLEASASRKVVGFDAFGEFPRTGDSDDQAFIERFEGAGGPGYPESEIAEYLSAKGVGNFELVAGNVFETLPSYLENRPHLRIALLHLDMDVYEPTKFVLETLSDRIVRTGLIVVDDYATVAGATRAVDEWNASRGLCVRKLPMAHIPAFIEVN